MWGDACGWARDRLPLLAGDDLAGDDRRRAQRHLIGCPSCRRRLESLREALSVLQGAAAVSPTKPSAPSLWPELERQIRESRRPAPSMSLPWPRIGLFSAVSLAAGLVVAVGVSRTRPDDPSRPVETVKLTPRIKIKAPILVVHPSAPKPVKPAPAKPADPAPAAPVVVQQAPPAKPAAPAEAVVNRREEAPEPAQAVEPTR